MIKNREKGLMLLFVIMAVIAIYFLFDRMVSNRGKFLNAGYTDKAFIELMDNLIADGIFKIDLTPAITPHFNKGGMGGISNESRISLNEKALSEKHLGKKTEERVRNNVSFLYIKNGMIYFDKQSVSIMNNRAFADERVLRGSFLDRNGVVLAKNIIDEKNWQQDRQYPYGFEFYDVIGHWNTIFGKRSLEKELDEYLTGRLHSPIVIETSDPFKKLQLGDDVILTLDSSLQRLAYSLMEGKKGAAVVLNVKTGEILAAVSLPSFDPNTKDRAKWRMAFEDDNRPYENRAFSALYPPGSTFKTIVASAWIETNLKSDYQVTCTGKKNKYDISDIHVHGRENLDSAYANSCNVFFSEVGVMLGKDLLDYSDKFGFNRRINLIPQLKDSSYQTETSSAFLWNGYHKDKSEIKTFDSLDFKRNPKLVAQGAIGQNLVTATPLQMAMVAATIANKGVLLNPYIVKEIRTGDNKKVLFVAEPVEISKVIKKTTAEKVRKLMIDVMQIGTGKDVKKIYFEDGRYTALPKNNEYRVIQVAGKTGTAEVGDKNGNGRIDLDEKPHSWFIGFTPADNPKFAIAVIAENQGFGSLTAAPIAMEVLAEALNSKIK